MIILERLLSSSSSISPSVSFIDETEEKITRVFCECNPHKRSLFTYYTKSKATFLLPITILFIGGVTLGLTQQHVFFQRIQLVKVEKEIQHLQSALQVDPIIESAVRFSLSN